MLVSCSLFPPQFSEITWLDASQSELSVNPSALVAATKTELSLSAVLAGERPKSMNFGVFPKDGIPCEVHPFLRVDFGNFSGGCFQTDYSTEVGPRVAIYGQKSINGSVEWLCIPAPFCDTGVDCTDNLLVSEPLWRDGDKIGY